MAPWPAEAPQTEPAASEELEEEAQEEMAGRPDPLLDEGFALDSGTAIAMQDPDTPSRPMGFIVSVTKGGRFRRLHFAGGCWRIAGEHYHRFEDWGQECPPADRVHARCSDCFPAGKAPAAPPPQAEDVEDDASSDTSSSSAHTSPPTPVGAGPAGQESG